MSTKSKKGKPRLRTKMMSNHRYDGRIKRKIAHDFHVFFMGHKGSMEAKYTTNKGMLPLELIEEMKQAFRRSEEFLDLEIRTEQKEKQHQPKEMETLQDGQANQMVVSIEQIEELIGKGWRLVAILPQGKAVCAHSGSGM